MSQSINNAATEAVESGIYTAETSKQDSSGLTSDPAAVKREAIQTAANLQNAANNAAVTAKTNFPQTTDQATTTLGDLQESLSAKTNEAVAEGQRNVQSAKDTGSSYLQQAQSYASDLVSTAQAYVEAGQAKVAPADGAQGVVASVQSAASGALGAAGGLLASTHTTLTSNGAADPLAAPPLSQRAVDAAVATKDTVTVIGQKAYETAAPYVSAANEKAQPHVQAAVQAAGNAAQPYVQSVNDTVQPHIQRVSDTASPYIQKGSDFAKSAQETLQPHINTATSAAKATVNSFNKGTADGDIELPTTTPAPVKFEE